MKNQFQHLCVVSALPNEHETRSYFQAAGLSLERIVDTSEPRGERWLLSKSSDGTTHRLQCRSCAESLEDLWKRWWLQFQTSEWHRGCAFLFAERRSLVSAKERQAIDDWIERQGYRSYAQRRDCWPWTSAYASYKGGSIHLHGWPWLDKPLLNSVRPMPPPYEWMATAQSADVIDARDPADFMSNLERAIFRYWFPD